MSRLFPLFIFVFKEEDLGGDIFPEKGK